MKVAILGSNGQLGADVTQAFSQDGHEVCPLTHADIEIGDLGSVEGALLQLEPRLIVNTVAMHQVETCEREPEKAFKVNGAGARNLASVARQLDAVLMHVSTDYVFDGSKGNPYVEEDVPRPLNSYGVTKLAGEHFVRSIAPKHFVLRTSGLYGKHPCRGKGGLNFVELMLKLGRERGKVRVVNDEMVSPTSTWELALQMVALSRSDSYGLYNATAEGSCSWHDFAKEIYAVAGVPATVEVASADEFPAKVPRPKYSVLENRALKAAGLNTFGPWEEGLRSYLGASVPALAGAR
jgi:dTDP-4-dehydrorhamnose reductase